MGDPRPHPIPALPSFHAPFAFCAPKSSTTFASFETPWSVPRPSPPFRGGDRLFSASPPLSRLGSPPIRFPLLHGCASGWQRACWLSLSDYSPAPGRRTVAACRLFGPARKVALGLVTSVAGALLTFLSRACLQSALPPTWLLLYGAGHYDRRRVLRSHCAHHGPLFHAAWRPGGSRSRRVGELVSGRRFRRPPHCLWTACRQEARWLEPSQLTTSPRSLLPELARNLATKLASNRIDFHSPNFPNSIA